MPSTASKIPLIYECSCYSLLTNNKQAPVILSIMAL